MFYESITINVKARFKQFQYIVCDDNKQLWQLPHFKKSSKREISFRKITYNKERNAWRINGIWRSRKELKQKMIKVDEVVEVYN